MVKNWHFGVQIFWPFVTATLGLDGLHLKKTKNRFFSMDYKDSSFHLHVYDNIVDIDQH